MCSRRGRGGGRGGNAGGCGWRGAVLYGGYLKDILARSERVEAGPAMKLGKARARAPKREREAAE